MKVIFTQNTEGVSITVSAEFSSASLTLAPSVSQGGCIADSTLSFAGLLAARLPGVLQQAELAVLHSQSEAMKSSNDALI
jgi:hypothetical protein